MGSKRTISARKDQPVVEGTQELNDGMAQEGQPLPVMMPEEEPFVPACPDCDEPMRFQRRITPTQHAVLFGKATPSRGPP